jgi:hypothetical protein
MIFTLFFFIIISIITISVWVRKEQFINYKQCENRTLNKITKYIFDKFGVTQNNHLFDLFIPCGYKTAESQLTKISFENKKIYAIKGCDKIVSKNNLWMLISNRYGREKAKTIMPETFLYNNDDLVLFRQQFKNDFYILKNNKQRKKGITITNDINKILYSNNRIIQVYKNSFIINKRKFNLRLYILIICMNRTKKIYLHDSSKCLYTSKDFVDISNFDENITNSYKTSNDIYITNPYTINDLYRYLDKNGYSSDVLKIKIKKIISLLASVIIQPVCNLAKLNSNTTFQLFGMDILLDEKLDPFILELNKGPDMNPKDERDEYFKTKILEDVFDKTSIIKTNRKNLFKQIII